MSRACIICHTPENIAFVKHGYDIYRCPKCGLFRTRLPGSYDKFLKNYYSKGYFTGSLSRAGYANYVDDSSVIRRNARNYLRLILRHRLPGRRLLDVGCATGIFLGEARNQGFTTHGIDPSAYAVTLARRNFNHQVKLGTLSTIKFSPRSFHLVTMFDVFEHLADPHGDLDRCYQLLRPGGLLVINTGNTNSFLAKLEKHRWHFFIPPQHLYFYSDTNLQRLLKLHGFKVLSLSTGGKHISLRYLWHLMRTINHSRLADWCYRHLSQTFIGRLAPYINLHDNMTLIAKKM